MGEDDRLRVLEGINPLPEIPSEFRWGSEFPPLEPLPVDDPAGKAAYPMTHGGVR